MLPKEEIAQLIEQINYYNYQYYHESVSDITDFEFDQLLNRLIVLETKYCDLKREDSPSQRVGGTITKHFETVIHQSPMLSLGNTYSADDLRDFDARVRKGLAGQVFEYVCELKFDGVAISLIYENGFLVRGVTRGDGAQGDDVTANVKTIKTIPLKLRGDVSSKLEVRGEIFMPNVAFETLNKKKIANGDDPLANPRNTAAGTLKMQDSSVVASRGLDCYLYSLLEEQDSVGTHEEAIKLLISWGFHVSDTYQKCETIEQVCIYIEKWDTKRKSLPVDTDGVVIKVNSLLHQKKLSFTAKNPRWAISFKYPTEQATTRLNEVVFQVGRTGAVTPVAELTPVSLGGTIVKRASLHNANEIERLDIRIGDYVYVEKGGEIIPKITGVVLEQRPDAAIALQYIDRCPVCQTMLIRKENEANHYCPNILGCPPQIQGRIAHFIHRKAMNIDSIGEQTIKQLYDHDLIRDFSDLYDLKREDILKLEGFKELSVNNILDGIEASKQTPFEQVLFGIGIRFVGKTVAEKLAIHFKNIDAIIRADFDTLIAVDEIGDRIAQSVMHFFSAEQNLIMIEKLKTTGLNFQVDESKYQVSSDTLQGLTFVISGVFEKYGREELKSIIKDHGGKVVSTISGKLNYLIAGDKMGPSKLKKAEKLKVNIITELEFATLLK